MVGILGELVLIVCALGAIVGILLEILDTVRDLKRDE